ncbi:Neurotransmitter-gated ion-channel transmembrane domain [Trinorchestia longiramus]|nr:Neurotransmitter-gated ion-channel transmembrane domain [Trinorchestia longiramus]
MRATCGGRGGKTHLPGSHHCGEHIGPCCYSKPYGCIGSGVASAAISIALPPPPPPPANSSPHVRKHSREENQNSQSKPGQSSSPSSSSPRKMHNSWSEVMEQRRHRAILIDRFSRVLFPLSFTILNVVYWGVFVVEWPTSASSSES